MCRPGAAQPPLELPLPDGAALISTVLGTLYPGPGTIYIAQTLKFLRPVTLGDIITVSVTVMEKFERNRHVILECKCVNQDGRSVIAGTAEVMAPMEHSNTSFLARKNGSGM